MFLTLLTGEVATSTETIVEMFSGLDFSGMVNIAVAIIPVAMAAALPIWTLKFGWNFLKSTVTGL